MKNGEASNDGISSVGTVPKSEAANHLCANCHGCEFVMPSETSSTGLRCGYQYFLVLPFLRKVTRMDHFPEVSAIHACERWHEKHLLKSA